MTSITVNELKKREQFLLDCVGDFKKIANNLGDLASKLASYNENDETLSQGSQPSLSRQISQGPATPGAVTPQIGIASRKGSKDSQGPLTPSQNPL